MHYYAGSQDQLPKHQKAQPTTAPLHKISLLNGSKHRAPPNPSLTKVHALFYMHLNVTIYIIEHDQFCPPVLVALKPSPEIKVLRKYQVLSHCQSLHQ